MKYAVSSDWTPVEKREPKHRAGWTYGREHDDIQRRHTPYTPGRHAKPFAKHHPATPLVTTAPVLDVVA